MTQRDHWLRLNEASRTPRRLVCFDSEAHLEQLPRGKRHRFRLAVASFDMLDASAQPEAPTEWQTFTRPADLWAWVVERTATQHRTVCYAHRLAYDLRLTRALELLPALGFEATRVVLNDYACWARFVKGSRTLILCDSLSWLPTTVDALAKDLRLPRPRLPAEGAGNASWERRCRADVEVVRQAMLKLLAWLHTDDLGDWRPTGPAQATAAFRHRFLVPRTVLVHWSGEPRAAERKAAWAGRAEVWQPGRHLGSIVEYDFTAAYAHIAEREQLPTRFLGQMSVRDPHAPPPLPPSRAGLYEVDVETELELLPAELDGRILWPVGSFRTVVWDCELQLALAHGAQVTVRRAWLYESGPVLRAWARWILAGLQGEPPGDDPVRYRVLKAWSRTLIGRFGLRYPALEPLRLEDEPDVQLATVWDATKGRGVVELQVGRQVFEQDGHVDSADSTPQLMSAVMAHARVRLWQLMQAAGEPNLLYVDTDSVLVTAEGAARIERRLRQHHFAGLRRKAEYTSADLRAPRNLDVGEQRRVAGLPRQAARLGPGRYQAEVWEGLPASMRRKRPAGVFQLDRTFTIGERDQRRQHTADGHTKPYRLQDGRPPE